MDIVFLARELLLKYSTNTEILSFAATQCRQLGDIRPLVESSEELTHVAKGLLDTVIGRLDDEAQRNLLSKVSCLVTCDSRHSTINPKLSTAQRGKDLDELIMKVSCVFLCFLLLNVLHITQFSC